MLRRTEMIDHPSQKGGCCTNTVRRPPFFADSQRVCAVISIHALREEGDLRAPTRTWPAASFLSTPSARWATGLIGAVFHGLEISIHALREEGDDAAAGRAALGLYFYPRPPRGGRHEAAKNREWQERFLSTPSTRRATRLNIIAAVGEVISIHALREEGDTSLRFGRTSANISIHALREEGDSLNTSKRENTEVFLSTPSARRATTGSKRAKKTLTISIHALREEGDLYGRGCSGALAQFLSTPSARRATADPLRCSAVASNFYPRPPRGGRQVGLGVRTPRIVISIHALREEGDGLLRALRTEQDTISIHALREEGDMEVLDSPAA